MSTTTFETNFRGLVLFGEGQRYLPPTYWAPSEGGAAEQLDGFEVEDWDTLGAWLADEDGWRRRDLRRSRAAGRLLPRLRAWLTENWGQDMLETLTEAP